MIERNDWTAMFESAIKNANAQKVATIQHVRTLQDYYEWINDLLVRLPGG